MISRFLICCLAASAIASGTCQWPLASSQEEVQERYVSAPSSVGFDIELLQTDSSSQQWLATYASHGKTAKFRIELSAPKPMNDEESRKFGINIESGKGRLIAEPGSDASLLLVDLKKALEAKTLPSRVQRVVTVPFTYVSFGNNQSEAPGGGFNAKPAGHWTPMKIFIGEGKQEGQVFVNLNPVIKKGQFSIKDPDFGDIVLAQLARVL
jgi:hypothetical protein